MRTTNIIMTERSHSKKLEMYLNLALAVAKNSTCIRRKYGAIIVKEDQIISTGYNGSPRGVTNCDDVSKCVRQEKNIPQGSNYELCMSVHAEQNAIISANRIDMVGSTLYLAGTDIDDNIIDSLPCLLCTKMIINAGIERVICLNSDGKYNILDDTKLKNTIENLKL